MGLTLCSNFAACVVFCCIFCNLKMQRPCAKDVEWTGHVLYFLCLKENYVFAISPAFACLLCIHPFLTFDLVEHNWFC